MDVGGKPLRRLAQQLTLGHLVAHRLDEGGWLADMLLHGDNHLFGGGKNDCGDLACVFVMGYPCPAMGAEGLSFDTIAVSGVNSNQPHGVPSDKKIQEGDFLTMDLGALYKGYCGDMTRTVAIGYATDEMKKIYDIVLRSQLAGLAAVKEGVLCRDVDKASRNIIDEAGYGEYYIHGTGHGVGIQVHEAPTLNARSEEILKENQAVTIEPGIYLPDKFGVRIEDLAIVTKFGIINCTRSEKELIIL